VQRPDGRPDPTWRWFARDAEDYDRFWLLVCSPSCRSCTWPRSVAEAEERVEAYINERSHLIGRVQAASLLRVIESEFAALRAGAWKTLSELDAVFEKGVVFETVVRPPPHADDGASASGGSRSVRRRPCLKYDAVSGCYAVSETSSGSDDEIAIAQPGASRDGMSADRAAPTRP